VVSINDITERKQIEEALKENEKKVSNNSLSQTQNIAI